ncbi:ABC transporter ATP-binding protein [Pokkaliibacter plantistimulans]|nr:ABC transporter ATP-binding protein [Pokkaliibacter plantistimulans]
MQSGMQLCTAGLEVSHQRKALLGPADVTVRQGELVALIGPNGAGKSTLLKSLAGLVSDYRGQIYLNDDSYRNLAPQQLARHIAYVPQQHQCAWPLTVREVVALGRLAQGNTVDQHHPLVDMALSRCDCLVLQNRTVNTLSGGELARVMLARALACDTPMLLADEPLAGLDPHHQLSIMAVLRRLAHLITEGSIIPKGVLVVLHDLELAARFADRVILMHNGKVRADGLASEVLVPAHINPVYGVDFRVDWQVRPPQIQALSPF